MRKYSMMSTTEFAGMNMICYYCYASVTPIAVHCALSTSREIYHSDKTGSNPVATTVPKAGKAYRPEPPR